MQMNVTRIGIALGGAAALVLVAATTVFANRCGSQNPPRCGLDAQTDPPTLPGGTGGYTDASLATLPLFKGSGMCRGREDRTLSPGSVTRAPRRT